VDEGPAASQVEAGRAPHCTDRRAGRPRVRALETRSCRSPAARWLTPLTPLTIRSPHSRTRSAERYDTYRAQLSEAGYKPAAAKAEVEACKAAIRKRRAAAKDQQAV